MLRGASTNIGFGRVPNYEPPAWPKGATPLAGLVKAPPVLAARLAFTALADRAEGDALQGQLQPGCRLV